MISKSDYDQPHLFIQRLELRMSFSRREFIRHATCGLVAAGAFSTSQAQAKSIDYYDGFDGLGLAELVRKKEVKPEELLESAIKKLDAINPIINTVVTKMYGEARRVARGELPNGPFRGVPFLLKDSSGPYAGFRHTYGSRALADFVAPADNEVVKRYKKVGLITFGKTNTPEFGLTLTTEPVLFGPTKNPWNKEYMVGGSSGGAAAAVAARIVPMAQGSDGGGSIRIPASCCGVFGFKPSRGRMPMGPRAGEVWEGFVTTHSLTISVRDSAAMLDATCGPDVGAPYGIAPPERPYLDVVQNPRFDNKLKIAWTTSGAAETVHPDCVYAARHAAKLCADLGHHVEEAAPNINYEELWSAFYLVVEIYTAAMLDNLVTLVGKPADPKELEAWTWQLAERGWQRKAVELAKVHSVINRATRALGEFFEKYDVLLTPTLASPPRKLGYFDTMKLTYEELKQRHLDFCPYTWLHNMAGTPAMSVPLHWNERGLPIGVQFAARLADEATLFGLAAQLESKQPWAGRRPPI